MSATTKRSLPSSSVAGPSKRARVSNTSFSTSDTKSVNEDESQYGEDMGQEEEEMSEIMKERKARKDARVRGSPVV